MDYDLTTSVVKFFLKNIDSCFNMRLVSEWYSRRLHFIIHKKCDIANLILVFGFKQNNDKETNLTSRKSMHSMKINEQWKLMKVNLTPPIQDAAFIQLVDFS